MDIRWKSEEIIFDTLRESEVWADSIANEIYGRTIDGYITPDYKVAYALSFFLASVPNFIVHTETCVIKDSFIYKVWVTTLTSAEQKNV
ncbi:MULTISPECIES: hypothetical protein [Bacillus]|uniref:Uncharacterized protein n=1 Tax=Bacillus pseudomycoides TaxID=64104 RepID=A0A1Y3MFM4_9BACI|nr:hypothetical protein KOW_05103 [Bacillus cereus VDM006]EOQ19189.1 hypothetical protein KOY_01488 [Bacillus cereus VDM021]OUM47661.1 hypothetical protein BW425_17020 [Bacillus pseudomycoides]PEE42747.1 hypothetical protein COO02_06195 [Bacillus pseudomycoides]PEI85050.1 hypothetical protein CN679_25195 [Bacillus pseudomycoides]